MTHNRDVHLFSGAYSLDAVSAEEAAAVEAEMARSEQLRGEIAELTDTAVMLGLAVAEKTPPPALRARLLDAIEHTPQLPAVPRQEHDDPDVPTVLAPVSTRAGHVAPARRRSRMRRRPAVLLSLAAVALLLFGGGLAVDRFAMQPDAGYSAIEDAPDVQTVSAPINGGGTATVSWSEQVDQTAVVLHGVDHPSGKVLQLWRLKGRSITSAGLYRATGNEHDVVRGALTSGEQLAVTVEPAGGSKQPTTPPVVLVKA